MLQRSAEILCYFLLTFDSRSVGVVMYLSAILLKKNY